MYGVTYTKYVTPGSNSPTVYVVAGWKLLVVATSVFEFVNVNSTWSVPDIL
jgi:hypothetical protein